MMTQISGTYYKGRVKLEEEVLVDSPVKILLTFLEDEVKSSPKKFLKTSDFGFKKAQNLLKNVKSSFADEVIEERRSYL